MLDVEVIAFSIRKVDNRLLSRSNVTVHHSKAFSFRLTMEYDCVVWM